MKRMFVNKRGQFFVIFAVILGILILAAASVLNFAKSEKNVDSFNAKCENYKNEIFEISKYASSNNKDQEFNFINQFSQSFIDYMNNTYDIKMYFLYGNNTNSVQVNIPGIETNHTTTNVTVNHDKFIRTYSLKEDNSFHFLMIARKNSETYVCES